MPIEEVLHGENPFDEFKFLSNYVIYNGIFLPHGKAAYVYFMIQKYFDHNKFSDSELRNELRDDASSLFHQSKHTKHAIAFLVRTKVLKEVERDTYIVAKDFSNPRDLCSYLKKETEEYRRRSTQRTAKIRKKLNLEIARKGRLLSQK